MERKIGEIFEYNGEWYQCLEEKTCTCFGCDFRDYNCDDISLKEVKGSCQSERRKDNKSVIFKKLEKVGGTYAHNSIIVQKYKIKTIPVIMPNEPYMYFNAIDNTIKIEIKQIKEDMKEKKHNLKPFDLEKARLGNPVCTRDGRNARIICFDSTLENYPLVVLVGDYPYSYTAEGKFNKDSESSSDLMMLSEKKEGWVNVYKGGLLDTKSYPTKKEAFDKAGPEGYVDTVKINWSE